MAQPRNSGMHSTQGISEAKKRQMAMAKRRAKIRKARRRRQRMLCGLLLVFIFLITGLIFLVHHLFASPVKSTLTWEAGSGTPTVSDFMKKDKKGATLLTAMDNLDLCAVGEYDIEIQIGTKHYDSRLKVVDHTAPEGTVVSVTAVLGTTIDPESFFEEIVDATQVTVSYKEQPDFTQSGTQEVTLILRDEGGNETQWTTTLTLVADSEPPVISGVEDQKVQVGNTISYKSGVTVTDNVDTDIELLVDNSEVDLNTAGIYTVTYSATDSAGNTTTATATITVIETEVNDAEATEEEIAYLEYLADAYLAQITTEDMTTKEVARAIWDWCNYNINYTSTSDKTSWVRAAIQAFDTHLGDCFNYFAAAKALLTQAGIDNIDVVKSDTSHSSHYWSLVYVDGGWYHFDTTPREGDGDYFFLVTDAQLEAYSEAHDNSHVFDHSLYPSTPETIITDMETGEEV